MYAVATRRGLLIRAVSIALLGLVGAAGCTMVGDNLTGVSLEKRKIESCIGNCNDVAQAAKELEQKIHNENISECQALPEDQQNACMDAESARHVDAVQGIQEIKKDCQNNCHKQGRGNAG
jgi:hypothetical protein